MLSAQVLNGLSCVFALIAAVLWWISATRPLQSVRDNIDVLVADIDAAVRTLRSQSWWSAWAATAAGVAAALQAASFIGH